MSGLRGARFSELRRLICISVEKAQLYLSLEGLVVSELRGPSFIRVERA